MVFSWRVISRKTAVSLRLEIAVVLLPFAMVSGALAEPFPGEGDDMSSLGPLKCLTIDFPDLVDANRTNPESSSSSARTRTRFRRESSQAETSSRVKGRRIPIQVHVPTVGGPYPVVVVSHGAGGNSETHYAQSQHLASYGYVVLCVEHVGSNTERLRSGLRPLENVNQMIRDANEVLGRPKDIRFAIDRAVEWNEKHNSLRGRLDTRHIGVLGHSFGAYTTMVVCGMRPALDWLQPSVAPGKGLGPDLSDRRVTCGVALSPQGADEPFFIRESFASLRVPLMGISGSEDKQQGGLPPINRYNAFSLWPSNHGLNRFVWLANAHHLDFTDSTGAQRQGIRSPNRNDVQKVVRAATLLFFDNHLKPNQIGMHELTTEGLRKYLHGMVDDVEVRSK